MNSLTAPTTRDREILRGLAGPLRGLAERPANAELEHEWTRHNKLEPGRALIVCSPEGAWPELVTEEEIRCETALARAWERTLRMQLYKATVLKDDEPAHRCFNVPWVVSIGDYGVPITETRAEDDPRGSYHYDPPLTDLPNDFARLHHRELSVDREETARRVAEADSIFGDLLPVRIRGSYWWTMGLTWEAIKLIGLDTLMFAPYDQPEALHRLMAWLRDEMLGFMTWFEREGLLSDQNENDYVGSGGLGFTDELPQPDRDPDAPARLVDRWGFAESQETVGVSPAMFSEYILPYQIPLLERFGLNCYGCCEPIEGRLDAVFTIPRLRRISVSPWADEKIVAPRLGRSYIYSRKPSPVPVCVDFDEPSIRADLRTTLEVARECRLELIMKDTHTVEWEADRLTRWVAIAREEAARAGLA